MGVGDGLAGLSYPNIVSGQNIPLATISLLALAPGWADISIGVTPGDLLTDHLEARASTRSRV